MKPCTLYTYRGYPVYVYAYPVYVYTYRGYIHCTWPVYTWPGTRTS